MVTGWLREDKARAPWPTEERPVGELPAGFDAAAIDEFLTSDRRHAITIDTMLHMRSGLEWVEEYEGTSDVIEKLFGPLGITSVVHDLDDTGVMSGGSAINMTALDFARFGLLCLRGGSWDDAPIVPTEWVNDARMPVPGDPIYGAHWWLTGTAGRFPESFAANGFNGQSITIVPELDLVVVVLANEPGARPDLVGQRVIQEFGYALAPTTTTEAP